MATRGGTIGGIANADRPRGLRAEPQMLADDVRYSLMLYEEPTAAPHGTSAAASCPSAGT